MQYVEEMLTSVTRQVLPTEIDAPSLRQAIAACLECQVICQMSADACANEADGTQLTRCLRLSLDCADLCVAVVRLLSRSGNTDVTALRALLEACASSCSACALECRKHAEQYEHCEICAQACEACARACQAELETRLEGPSA
jgi:uncharacterized membrane protein